MINNLIIEQAYTKVRHTFESRLWYFVGLANAVSGNAITDAYDGIEDAGLLKMQVKYDAKKALRAYDTYLARFQRQFGSKFAIWQDMLRIAADDMRPDVQRLTDALKVMLAKHLEKDIDLLALVITADGMLSVSTALYDDVVRYFQQQTPLDIQQGYHFCRLSSAAVAWRRLTNHFQDTPYIIDPNQDDGVGNAMSNIIERYRTIHPTLERAAKDSITLNEKYINVEKEYLEA